MRRLGLLVPSLLIGTTTTFAFSQGAPATSPAPSGSASGSAAPSASASAAPAANEDVIEEVPAEIDEGPKPDAKAGVVTGLLTDAKTGEEIIDGQCAVAGTKTAVVTDADGRFVLKLPPGSYQIRCFFEGYLTKRVDGVVVAAGKTVKLAVGLERDEKKAAAVEEVVVEVDPDRTTPATQMLLRKNSANASDAVSAKDIQRTPDRNAADATKRVVGTTVVDGRFVYVRGLGDRYTNSLLNGTPLPSPEPDLQAIPLDIFPVGVLSDITIYKTFTPDLPADFAGGSVRIQTRAFPTKFFFAFNLTAGANDQTTFRDRTGYAGSRTDYLGYDSGARGLQGWFPGFASGSPAEMDAYGRSLSQKPRVLGPQLTGPNWGFSATLGDTITVLGNPLGFITSIGYGRRWSYRNETQRTYEFGEGDKLVPRVDYAGTRSTSMATLSGLVGLGYQIGQHHRFTLTGLYSGNGEDDVLQLRGLSRNDDAYVEVTRARWVERRLGFLQLLGEHKFPAMANALVKWNAFLGVASRGEPNNVQSVYQRPSGSPDEPLTARSLDGLTHFYSDQTEVMKGGGLDFSQPLSRAEDAPKIKAGGLFTHRSRDFSARRFQWLFLSKPGLYDWLQTPSGRILNESTIGSYARLKENTRASDVYTATQGVYAGYVMGDVPIGRLRFVGGARFEYTNLRILSHDDLETGNPETRDGYEKLDALPSLGVVYKLSDAMNLRASVTQTVARPQFREVARFDYTDYFNALPAVGNPAIKRTRITNFDLRWEFFPAADEVLAASVFYKDFQDPIESAFVLSSSTLTRKPQNAKSARNLGVELEARKRLGFLAPWMSGFTVLANLTLVSSRVVIADDQKGVATNLERPLAGQSPWVVNAALDWTSKDERTRARVSYNVFGKRIDAVGALRLPDTYEMPRNVVDVSVSQKLSPALDAKLSVENALDAPYVFKTGSLEAQRWSMGRSYWVSLAGEL